MLSELLSSSAFAKEMRLLDYAKNVYSQSGEDGIIAKILETLATNDKWCVEFGAWDGRHLSNSCNLIENSGYSAVLIEGDPIRANDLRQRHAENPKISVSNKFVGFGRSDGLDAMLAQSLIPRDFDFLSIDIDGNDYHVWKAVENYTPKVVCIEYNPTIPTEVQFVQSPDPRVNQGSSLLSLTLLAREKNYQLVAVTPLNAIFVQAQYFSLFGISRNEPATLREDSSAVAQIFCGYDGTIFIAGQKHLLWHNIPYQSRIRQLPPIFRSYPGNFGASKAFLYRTYQKFCNLLKKG